MSNITGAQWRSIIVIVLGVIVGGSTQLTDMGVPPVAVKAIVGAAGLLLAIMGGLGTVFQSQSNQVKTVEQMPGVKKILTGPEANETLSAIAESDDHPKVEKSA